MNTPVSVKGEKPATSRGILASLPFDNCSIAAAIGCELRRGRLGLKLVLILTVLAVGLAAGPSGAGATDVTPFTVSIPAVTGPIASTATPANYAFIANGFGIAPQLPIGYAEEEYFVSGTANIYEWTPTGVEIATPCPIASCTGISYTTRMLVKHPINPEQFSGTVIVEPLNPSAGYDISAVWDRSNAYFVRSHDIFVGFTSKSVAVNAIKTWNPTRYAALNWPYLPFSPGSNNAQLDGMTWDIAAQIGALFKANGPTSPINAFHVQQVFEAGFSQDGSFVFAQINGFHMLELLPGGGTIYDGYVPGGTVGPSNINFGLTSAGALSLSDPRNKIQPRNVPVIQTNTESEIVYGLVRPGGLLYRRPDSDAPNDRTRIWEVAGATHGDADIVGEPGGSPNWASWELLGIPLFPAPGTQFFVTCDHSFNGAPNRFPFKYIANAAFDGLIRWISGGKPPPHAPFISLDPTELQGIARDTFGNAIGGVRTPYLDVPIATYAEDNPQPACALNGFTLPFADSTLDGLYADHGQYEGLVDHETKTLLKDNWFVLADADTVMQDATYALVP